MSNNEKYLNVFVEILDITEEEAAGLTYQEVESWDSVGHMSLVSALEETFDITMAMKDIIDFNSFEQGKEILASNYGIEF